MPSNAPYTEAAQDPGATGELSNLRQERFLYTMDDADILAQVQAWGQECESAYEALNRARDQNMAYYQGQQTGVERIHGKRSKAVENRIFMAVETMVPIATSRPPEVVAVPGDDDEQSILDAMDLQDVLNHRLDLSGIQGIAERFVRDLLLKRYGVLKVRWVRDDDDVFVEYVDARRVWIPRFGKSVRALAFVMEDLELDYEALVRYFGEAVADRIAGTYPNEATGATKVRTATFAVREVWTNDTVVWVCHSEVAKKMANPYWDAEGARNYLDAPEKPYAIEGLFETEESLIGDTDYVQQVIPIQDNINTRKRQIEDITNEVANPYLLIDSQVMTEEEAANVSNEPGAVLYGKDAAKGDKIRFERPGQVPQYLFADLDTSRAAFDNVWGTHPTTRGEREGRETLGGRQILREADLGRIDPVGRKLDRALDRTADLMTQLIALFYTEAKAVTILGPDGARFVQGFTGSKVGKSVPMVKPGSTLKEDEFQVSQKAIVLWQNKAIGIKTLYRMLKMPNPQKAIEDYIETQSGALLAQAQQGPGQVANPGQEPGQPQAVPPVDNSPVAGLV